MPTNTIHRTVLRSAAVVFVADQLTKLAGTHNLGGTTTKANPTRTTPTSTRPAPQPRADGHNRRRF